MTSERKSHDNVAQAKYPSLKQECDLTPADFQRCAVWIGVHNYDSDEPWYEQGDEETYRPWTGKLPFKEIRGIALVAARFTLADGSTYPGYCTAVREDWDDVPTPWRGTRTAPQSWSQIHGGTRLSILALQNPTLFVGNRALMFHLGIPERRKEMVQGFYATIRKKPSEIFPLSFAANPRLAAGVITGKLDGFFYFPTGGTRFEIDTGESYLHESVATVANPSDDGDAHEFLDEPSPSNRLTDSESRTELTVEDFRRNLVWVAVPTGETRSLRNRFKFIPWHGCLPVDSETHDVRVPATFVLRNGSEYEGYIRVVPDNWLDITPPPIVLERGSTIQTKSPRIRFGGSLRAIIGAHLPCLFTDGGKKLSFWCGIKDSDDVKREFYQSIPKKPEDVFPIHFRGRQGLATGIASGEIEGFYEVEWATGKPPKIVY
jgi:hypothetical protein